MDTSMSNRLTVLANEIKNEHAFAEADAERSYFHQMKVAKAILEARQALPADRDFGMWLVDNDMTDKPSSDDRAGYILMAQHPELASEAFGEGKWSPRNIGKWIRKELDRLPPPVTLPVSQGCETVPLETKIPETISSVPQEAVNVIEPAEEPTPKVETPAETAPVTVPGNPAPAPSPAPAPAPAQPAATSNRGKRKHPLEACFKDQTVIETIFQLWGRRGNHSSVTLNRLSGKPANRPMVLKMIEAVQANGWTPSVGIHALTPALLNQAFKGRGTTYKETPTGIQACIDEAIQLDRKAKGLVDKEAEARQRAAYEAMLARLKASANPTTVPSDAGERFNTPAGDEDIVVYGKVIREKGTHPEVYQDWWQGAEFVFHILQVFGHLKPEQLRNVGHTLKTARHWVRGLNVYQLELVLGEIGNAMENAVDPASGLVSATANVRHANK